MYEKLDKLRTDLKRAREKRVEIDAKIKNLEQRLKEAEEAQILTDVKQLNLTPEQVARFLQLATSGKLPMPGGEEAERMVDQMYEDSILEEGDEGPDEELPF